MQIAATEVPLLDTIDEIKLRGIEELKLSNSSNEKTNSRSSEPEQPFQVVVASKADKKVLFEFCKTGQGFSAVQRRDAWVLATGTLQIMISSPPDYYADLVDYSQTLYQTYPSQNRHQIRLDLPRTFADEVYFSQNSGIGREISNTIERICLAYSVRNSVIGYCQGFNFLVGRLL